MRTLLLTMIAVCCIGLSAQVPGKLPAFGISFPPVKNTEEMEFTAGHLKELGVRSVRISESWKLREPEPGKFNWAALDNRIRFIQDNKLSLMLTIEAEGPEWACSSIHENWCEFKDDAAFKNFISELLRRYSGKIDKIQFGNEWDAWYGYGGPAEDFIRLNNILFDETRKISPGTKVVLGGLTRSLPVYAHMIMNKKDLVYPAHEFLVEGVTADSVRRKILREGKRLLERGLETRVKEVMKNAKYDMVDLHLYDDPENWQLPVEYFKGLTDKPMIVSEFGCPSPEFEKYSQTYQSKRLAACIATLKSLHIAEAYHFTLVDQPGAYHKNNGLIDISLDRKQAYGVFKEIIKGTAGGLPQNR